MFSINKNLVTLKCVLFLFLAGVGCFFPFLPAHIRTVGLSAHSVVLISVLAPLFSVCGPFIVGRIADKYPVGRGGWETQSKQNGVIVQNNGDNRVLRYMIAFCLIGAALFYSLLMAVPPVQQIPPQTQSVNFMCNSTTAVIYQEMCSYENVCHEWSNRKLEDILELSKCRYACQKPPIAKSLLYDSTSTPESVTFEKSIDDEVETEQTIYVGTEQPIDVGNEEAADEYNTEGIEPNTTASYDTRPPHICRSKDGINTMCHVFTPFTDTMNLETYLADGTEYQREFVSENNTAWCIFPLVGSFECLVPPDEIISLAAMEENTTCNPIIECDVDNPYESSKSVLKQTKCKPFLGNPTKTFVLYLLFRSLGDIFATAVLCLLCTACVIATRETSVGRGDVGQQLAFGIIGMALIPPLVGLIHEDIAADTSLPQYIVPILSMMILFILAAIIMVFSKEMPLTPPEWWWHTKSGMLALPMNTVRRYGLETAGIVAVLIILGIFWSGLDTYLTWTIKDMAGSDILVALTMTIGSIPAIPVLWKAERVVDYFGHSNIFIGAFAFYIIRYTGMAILDDPWWVLLCEVFEVFTLSLMWVTAVLYFRHLIPRKYTSIGQALPVVAHFCLGRALGALIGFTVKYGIPVERLQMAYGEMAIVACVIGLLYLIIYHLLLAPLCRASTTGPPNPTEMRGMNTNGTSNGSYTPLRVYHNERAKKGQFKY